MLKRIIFLYFFDHRVVHGSGHLHQVDPFTCIIDQDVKPLLSLKEALAEFPHRAQVGQIQLHVKDVQAVTLELDLPHSLLSLVHISASDDDTGASHGQGNSCVLANARVATCKETK